MTGKTLKIDMRRRQILERLDRDHTVTVAQLSRELGATPVTIRKDLAALEAESRLRRVRGGAVDASPELLFGALSQEKAAIGSGRFEGMTVPVLVEEINDHDTSMVTGRMSQNILVHFPGEKDLIGKIVNVHLLCSKGFYYIGEMADK